MKGIRLTKIKRKREMRKKDRGDKNLMDYAGERERERERDRESRSTVYVSSKNLSKNNDQHSGNHTEEGEHTLHNSLCSKKAIHQTSIKPSKLRFTNFGN